MARQLLAALLCVLVLWIGLPGGAANPLYFCGDSYCIAPENRTACPADCISNRCGNRICSGSENKDNCPVDCYTVNASRNMSDLYHSKADALDRWKQLCRGHPAVCRFESIGRTLQNRSIYLFKVGNCSSTRRAVFDGAIHGAEDCGTETGYEFVRFLLENDSQETNMLLSRKCALFIPIINLDSTRRQNMRRSYGSTAVRWGVDLNRNFAYHWGSSGSGNPLDPYAYRGRAAASEPETQAVTRAMAKYRMKAYVNVHCGSETLKFYRNDSMTRKILDEIRAISAGINGSDTLGIYPVSMNSIGGYAHTQAAYYNASAWLFEISKWENLPVTLEGYHERWYRHAFPVYLAVMRSI